jgi:hypothetical protein
MRNTLSAPLAAIAALSISALLAGMSSPAFAQDASTEKLHNWWDFRPAAGRTTLYRSEAGLKATVLIIQREAVPDHVYTLWFIVFNTPEGCLTSPCTVVDVENPAAGADFVYGGGVVTGDRRVDFGGSLETGDTSGSGFNELGLPELAQGVTDPFGAEVMLAIHSHGPAGSGTILADQISSYLGGCLEFLGPGGFAASAEDVPDEVGECSTIMYSIHQP